MKEQSGQVLYSPERTGITQINYIVNFLLYCTVLLYVQLVWAMTGMELWKVWHAAATMYYHITTTENGFGSWPAKTSGALFGRQTLWHSLIITALEQGIFLSSQETRSFLHLSALPHFLHTCTHVLEERMWSYREETNCSHLCHRH